MKYDILPKALYNHPSVKKVLYHNDSCILYKRLKESVLEQEKISISHCFLFVEKGKVEVKTYEGESVVLHENEMLFMPRDTYLISDFIKDQDCIDVFLVFFDHEIVIKFLSSKIKQHRNLSAATPTICKLKTNNKFIHYFNSLRDIYFDLENDKEILELKILEFLHLIYLRNQSEIINTLNSSENQKKKRRIESIMIDNYDKNFTVTDFANLSGRSLSTFNRDFKRKHGQTPKQWLIKKKMEKAKVLLSEGMNVTTCAIEIGYSNVSNFIKAYKLIHGETPNKTMRKN
ncbi:MAG: helix-turn-helix transcriptional regulator [Methylococcales bacterium]|nr:helix-turn-helix transcriptional regulator [Methylococcales bacterium]